VCAQVRGVKNQLQKKQNQLQEIEMKTFAVVAGSLLLFGVSAVAQEAPETPKVEFGLNYSYSRINPSGVLSSYNTNGGFGYAQYNFSKSFGVVADLGANYVGSANGVQLGNTTFEYLFGPRFTWRHSRYSPYVQTLFGGERFSNGLIPQSGTPILGASQNNFAAAFGGGLDVTLTPHVAVKPFQVDYMMTQFSPGGGYANAVANNIRYSAGIVFRLGSK
jgi:opacity protein-like surface antigen